MDKLYDRLGFFGLGLNIGGGFALAPSRAMIIMALIGSTLCIITLCLDDGTGR